MDKTSFLFLLILAAVALIFTYEAFNPAAYATQTLLDALGFAAFFLLCLSLLIGPSAVLWPKTGMPLIGAARAVGLAAFVFTLAHVLVAVASGGRLDFSFIAGNAFLMAGAAGALIILLLALTSSDWAIKKLGMGAWKNIQRLNYLAFLFAFIHFIGMARASFANGMHWLAAAMAGLGVLTVLLQLAGFWVRYNRGRKGAPGQEAQAEP